MENTRKLNPDFGTIEVRVMDSQPTIKEAIALTALVHSLIVYLHHCCLGEEGGFMLSRQPWAFEKENYFRASQQGIDAIYIEDEAGHTRSLTAIGRDILGALKPTAADLGETKHLQFLEQRLAGEVSYLRQRRVWAQTGSLPAVVAALVEELQERGSEFFPLTRHPEKQAA